jgi:hypothetical protein
MLQQNQPRSVRASYQGIEKLKQAKEARRVSNNGRLSYAAIAEKVYVEESTVKRFFQGTPIYTENAEAICEALGLTLAAVVDLKDLNQVGSSNGTKITLKGRVDEVKPMLDNLLDALRKDAGDQTITIRIIKEGSVIIIIDGSNEGLKRLESRFKAGELKQIAGFTVEDLRPEWEEKPVNLSQWFENILITGWQTVEQLLTPQQLRPAYFSESIQRGKRIDLQIDLITHTVILLMSLTCEDADRVIVNLKVFPTADIPHLPANLKLILLVEGEIFKEITSRSADQYIQYEFEAEPGDEFAVKLALGEAEITENFVV